MLGPSCSFEREGSMRQFLTVKRIAIAGVTALALLSTLAATFVIGHQGTARAAAPQVTISRLTSHGTGRLTAASAATGGPAVKHRFRQPFEKDSAESGSTEIGRASCRERV